jgi:hypothetical protein
MQVRTGFFLATSVFALLLAAPVGAFAQATFNERYPAEQTQQAQPAAEPAARAQQPVYRRARVVTARRARSRVVVMQRSFLDAGTEVQPGERKFLDYAFPPTHTTYGIVTNTGGRVGWHNSPLPGPFFPTNN